LSFHAKGRRFCVTNKHGDWRRALKPTLCDKGFIMTFLHWICETYLQKRRKKSKRKTVNQYWRDFKMLYRRCNEGRVVNPNACEEIRKVPYWQPHCQPHTRRMLMCPSISIPN
jgi:hypothetical protein